MRNKKILLGAISLAPLLAPFAFASCVFNKKEPKETEDQKLQKQIQTKITELKKASESFKDFKSLKESFDKKIVEVKKNVKGSKDIKILNEAITKLSLVESFINDKNVSSFIADYSSTINKVYNSIKDGKLPHEIKIKADYKNLEKLIKDDFLTKKEEIIKAFDPLKKVLDKTIYGWYSAARITNIKLAINSLLEPKKLEKIFGATGLNIKDVVKNELEAILPELDKLLSKEFEREDFSNSEVQTLAKKVAKLFAKYFREIVNEKFNNLKIAENELKEVKKVFDAKSKFVNFTLEDGKRPYQFWISKYTLIDYSQTLLKEFMSSAYHILSVATKEENEGKKFDQGATLTNVDESKLTLDFVLVNKILWDFQIDDHSASVIEGYDNFKLEITKK